MATIITNKDDVIMAIGINYSESETEPGTVFLDGAGYALFGQKVYQDIEVPSGVVPDIYTYDGSTFLAYTSEIERIKQDAIDEYTIQLIEGGTL